MKTLFSYDLLLPASYGGSKIDSSYEEWLNDSSIEHDNNHDNKINEDDYAYYLNTKAEKYEEAHV